MKELIESEENLKDLLWFAFIAGCEFVDSKYCEGYHLDYSCFDEWFEKRKNYIKANIVIP